jgi:SAM-dependent methyltransferase
MTMATTDRYVPAAGLAALTRLYDPAMALTMRDGAWRPALRDRVLDALPLEDGCADAVVMSLLLHHLESDGKRAALEEARRVLRPEGRLHIADWGKPQGALLRAGFLFLQLLDGFANTRDHAAGRLPAFIEAAGFDEATTWRRLRTPWGSFELTSARWGRA